MAGDSDKPVTVTERINEYIEAAPAGRPRFVTDDAALEMIGEAFLKPPAPKVEIREVIPPGFTADPDIMEYQQAKQDPLFDLVRKKMVAELDPDEAEAANKNHEIFNWEYRRKRESLVQEREAIEAREKIVRDKAEAAKDRLRKLMDGKDPAKALDAAAKYVERFVR